MYFGRKHVETAASCSRNTFYLFQVSDALHPFVPDFFSARLQTRSVLDREDKEFQMWERNIS